jgi:hypothetical protein
MMPPDSPDSSSIASSPVFEAIQFVFRFTLAWQAVRPPTMNLASPRLPGPAQSRLVTRFSMMGGDFMFDGRATPVFRRSPSPQENVPTPVIPPTRRFSGLIQPGLVSEARNARPLEDEEITIPERSKRRSLIMLGSEARKTSPSREAPNNGLPQQLTLDWDLPQLDLDWTVSVSNDTTKARMEAPQTYQPTSPPQVEYRQQPPRTMSSVKPTCPPTGSSARAATYAGRALAEWYLVVAEFNGFAERRREEGVYSLSEVEVPSLGVEGLGPRSWGN